MHADSINSHSSDRDADVGQIGVHPMLDGHTGSLTTLANQYLQLSCGFNGELPGQLSISRGGVRCNDLETEPNGWLGVTGCRAGQICCGVIGYRLLRKHDELRFI